MVTTKQLRIAIFPLFALLTAAASTGCTSLAVRAPETATVETETTSVTDPMVVVELRSGNDKREYLRAPLKESMLVQDALKGSGAIHRFHRMDIVLVRHAKGGQKLRLPVRFSSTERRVVNEHNYALHGGDWLEVTQDTSTTFDRMIEQALEPLEPVMRSYLD